MSKSLLYNSNTNLYYFSIGSVNFIVDEQLLNLNGFNPSGSLPAKYSSLKSPLTNAIFVKMDKSLIPLNIKTQFQPTKVFNNIRFLKYDNGNTMSFKIFNSYDVLNFEGINGAIFPNFIVVDFFISPVGGEGTYVCAYGNSTSFSQFTTMYSSFVEVTVELV